MCVILNSILDIMYVSFWRVLVPLRSSKGQWFCFQFTWLNITLNSVSWAATQVPVSCVCWPRLHPCASLFQLSARDLAKFIYRILIFPPSAFSSVSLVALNSTLSLFWPGILCFLLMFWSCHLEQTGVCLQTGNDENGKLTHCCSLFSTGLTLSESACLSPFLIPVEKHRGLCAEVTAVDSGMGGRLTGAS